MKRFLPWLSLFLGAGLLALRYPSFPARWAVHWNAFGQVDGWADKSWTSAALPLLLALGLTVLFEVLVLVGGQVRYSKLPAPWGERMAAANRGYIHYISTLLNLFLGYLACTLPFGPPPVACIFLLVTGTVLYPALDFARLAREMRSQGALPNGYGGGFYNNADDARLWVPKLSGYGWTLNLAHGRARLLLAALILVPVAVSLLILRSVAPH